MQNALTIRNPLTVPVEGKREKSSPPPLLRFCCGLLICGLLAGCGGVTDHVPSKTASSIESAVSSSPESESPQSSSVPEKMSYEEYFSVERELSPDPAPDAAYSFESVAKDKNESYFLTDAERELIYRDCEMIDRFCIYYEAIFYQKGQEIYRLYRPTMTLDKLCTVEKPIEIFIPLSNIALYYLVPTPEGDAYRAEHNGSTMDAPDNIRLSHTWIYNSKTGELTDDLTPYLSVDSNGREWFDYHISAK